MLLALYICLSKQLTEFGIIPLKLVIIVTMKEHNNESTDRLVFDKHSYRVVLLSDGINTIETEITLKLRYINNKIVQI